MLTPNQLLAQLREMEDQIEADIAGESRGLLRLSRASLMLAIERNKIRRQVLAPLKAVIALAEQKL